MSFPYDLQFSIDSLQILDDTGIILEKVYYVDLRDYIHLSYQTIPPEESETLTFERIPHLTLTMMTSLQERFPHLHLLLTTVPSFPMHMPELEYLENDDNIALVYLYYWYNSYQKSTSLEGDTTQLSVDYNDFYLKGGLLICTLDEVEAMCVVTYTGDILFATDNMHAFSHACRQILPLLDPFIYRHPHLETSTEMLCLLAQNSSTEHVGLIKEHLKMLQEFNLPLMLPDYKNHVIAEESLVI